MTLLLHCHLGNTSLPSLNAGFLLNLIIMHVIKTNGYILSFVLI